MMQKRLRALALNSVLLILLLTTCKKRQPITGEWYLESTNTYLSEEVTTVFSSDSEWHINQLQKLFPFQLKKGDLLNIKAANFLTYNNTDTLRYKVYSSSLNIRRGDIVYPLSFSVRNGELTINRTIWIGKIEWKFSRIQI